MCTNLFQDSRLFFLIREIDKDREASTASSPCSHCKGKLDRSFFPRKPRAVPKEFEEEFSLRPSFCCRTDGCRKRATPPQLRFLGRKVYVSIIVVIAAAMTQGLSPKRLCEIERVLSVPPRTVRRWLQFWTRIFPNKSSWDYHRGNFMPPLDELKLPGVLLERLHLTQRGCLQAIIALLSIVLSDHRGPYPNVLNN